MLCIVELYECRHNEVSILRNRSGSVRLFVGDSQAASASRALGSNSHPRHGRGQLTVQAVPPDERPWIEGTGCTAMYQRLRRGIRDYSRRNYPLLPGFGSMRT
jgi:hypothetical protein